MSHASIPLGPNLQQVGDALSRSTKVMPKHTYQKYIEQGELGMALG
jgi:hypothetical protein